MVLAVPVGALRRRVEPLAAAAAEDELVEVACFVQRVGEKSRPLERELDVEPASGDGIAVGAELGVAPEDVAVGAGQELGLAVEPRSVAAAAAAGSDAADCCSGSTRCSACLAGSTVRQ